MKTFFSLSICICLTLLLGACGEKTNQETQNNVDSTNVEKQDSIVPKTIEDYFKQLKARNYFTRNYSKDIDSLKIDTLDAINGFMQVSLPKGTQEDTNQVVKIAMKLWNKRKSGKDLVGLLRRNCTSQCTFSEPVFLEFDNDNYQDVTKTHYPENLQTYLKRRLADYAKTCTRATPFNAALLPQQGVDIQLVAMSNGKTPCPQALLGLLKYNGDGFTFIEPVGKEDN